MDGSERKLTRSLQFRLSVGLSLVVAAMALVAGAFAFETAYQEAIELQDRQLRQMAALLGSRRATVPTLQSGEDSSDDNDPEEQVAFQFLGKAHAEKTVLAGELPELPNNLPEGIQTVSVNSLSWRLFVRTLDSDNRVAVGQRTVVREEIARDSAVRTIIPLLLVIPALLILVGYLIRTMFHPLKQAASSIYRRSDDDLTAIVTEAWPLEVQPFVVAINRLLQKVGEAVAVRKRFVTDAAHELRSPLTALSLQAERLAAADMPEVARYRLAALCQGIARARNLLDQLLTLVRVQGVVQDIPAQVSLQQVLRQVLEDLMPLVEAKTLDLGVVGEKDFKVWSNASDLYILVRNLLDNAIHYTPEGGRIDISIVETEATVLLRIDDSGPGIPKNEHKRVFDPFYRVPGSSEMGSGLGLSIVRTIAERMKTDIWLGYADEELRSGLCVQVAFPRIDKEGQRPLRRSSSRPPV